MIEPAKLNLDAVLALRECIEEVPIVDDAALRQPHTLDDRYWNPLLWIVRVLFVWRTDLDFVGLSAVVVVGELLLFTIAVPPLQNERDFLRVVGHLQNSEVGRVLRIDLDPVDAQNVHPHVCQQLISPVGAEDAYHVHPATIWKLNGH